MKLKDYLWFHYPIKYWIENLQAGKINDSKLRHRVVRLVQEAGQAVSAAYVAECLELDWTTAKTILLDLSLNHELVAIKTTKSWVFNPKEGETPPTQEPLARIRGR